MKFLVLAALVAASSAAGLRASADIDSLDAWYSFDGKGDCVAKAVVNTTEHVLATSNRVLTVLKKHSAFTDIVGEIEYIRDTFLEQLEIFSAETRDVNVLRLAQKVVANIPVFVQLSVRSAALTARFQLLPAQLMTTESATVFAEALGPISDLAELPGDLAVAIKDCV